MAEAEGRETHIILGLMAEQSETQMLGFVELREMIPMCCLSIEGGLKPTLPETVFLKGVGFLNLCPIHEPMGGGFLSSAQNNKQS